MIFCTILVLCISIGISFPFVNLIDIVHTSNLLAVSGAHFNNAFGRRCAFASNYQKLYVTAQDYGDFPQSGETLPDLRVLLRDEFGKRVLLLGNEAVARGAIEASVAVVTTYPGTPASEIGDSISAIASEARLYMEYSTNEIVATEVGAGAAECGIRALTAMKHVGLNVASDLIMTLAYAGVRGGYVIVTADDPECYSSQNEQDNRFYSLLSGLPYGTL